MPRKPRFTLPGAAVHAVQRGHNRAAVFFDDLDRLEYLRCLKHSADARGCVIHAYVLMTNHVHLLLTPQGTDGVGRLFQDLGRHYVRHINQTYQRHGSLWEGRYKSNLVDSQAYLLACMRYIELNPVRAAMVDHPADYRWSSYAANALGKDNILLTPHAEYLALGRDGYLGLFQDNDDTQALALLRRAVQTGTPLGREQFTREIEAASGLRVGSDRRGRPAKPRSSPSVGPAG
jgi:putative transposase